jgi:flagellar motor switch protein FliG
MGPVKVSEVDSAQQEIVNIAKKLEGEGKLFVARGGEGDALV